MIIKEIKKLIHELLQPDSLATFVNYTVKLFLNPIIVLFVPVFLSETVQGYWYTFGSIAALTTFADLGFTSILTQFAAHEYAYLSIDKDKKGFLGEQKYLDRISSLFQFLIRWMRIVLIIATAVILIAGIIMFSREADGVHWVAPWVLYVIATIINFASQVGLSFFEGCDQFAITQRVRTIASVFHCLATIALLALGFGLYALAIPLFIKAAIVFLSLKLRFGYAIRQLIHTIPEVEVKWKNEFVPLLGRYAISWGSGYFSSQLFNPLVFALFGSTAAGKVGYSLSIIQAIYSISNVWSLITIPKYNISVERKAWNEMDVLLKRNILYSSLFYSLGLGALFGSQYISILRKLIWSRIMPATAVLALAAGYYLSVISYALSTYLRAHKKEPFMVPSVILGVVSSILTVVFLYLLGLNSVFGGILLGQIVVLPISFSIWKRDREKWHQ